MVSNFYNLCGVKVWGLMWGLIFKRKSGVLFYTVSILEHMLILNMFEEIGFDLNVWHRLTLH